MMASRSSVERFADAGDEALQAVLSLGFTAGTAARGAFLAFVYGLGLGVPFLIVAAAMQLGTAMLGFARRHARLIALLGGGMLVGLGVLEVTGAYAILIFWLKVRWLAGYTAPL